jgi:hypothetical protein
MQSKILGQMNHTTEVSMKFHALTRKEILKSVVIGVLTAIALSAIMLPAFKYGIAPMPKQPSLAFAETLLGRPLPLPVGLLFHVAYLTFWSVVYVAMFRDQLTFLNALWLALGLWLVILIVFFPFIGWGIFRSGGQPKTDSRLAYSTCSLCGRLVGNVLYRIQITISTKDRDLRGNILHYDACSKIPGAFLLGRLL